MGVEIGSDWQDKRADDPTFGLYRECGFWTKGESRLLKQWVNQIGGRWLEIGAHTGWCTNIIAEPRAGGSGEYPEQVHIVTAIEPMFSMPEWFHRFMANSSFRNMARIMPWAGRSSQFFDIWDGGGGRTFDGCLIDGDHCGDNPLNDAKGCFDRLNERGVILLHDFRGPDVWDAAKYLVDRGLKFKVYPSVHMVCVCWRGEFNPPAPVQEGAHDWAAHYGLPEWAR